MPAFDATLAVQTGAYTALTVPDRPDGVPVWQHVPDGLEPPVVVIDKVTLTPIGGKGGGFDEAELDIVTLHTGAGREFLTPIMAENRARIAEQLLTADGAVLSRPVFVSEDTGLLDDGITYFGTQRFSLFVQPSD